MILQGLWSCYPHGTGEKSEEALCAGEKSEEALFAGIFETMASS